MSDLEFSQWLDEFVAILIDSGLSEPQANRFRYRYRSDSKWHFDNGDSPAEAASKQLMPGPM